MTTSMLTPNPSQEISLERKVSIKDILSTAKHFVSVEVKATYENSRNTVAAYVVWAIEAKYFRGVGAREGRVAAINAQMIRAGMSYGKANAYAKIAEFIGTGLVKAHGQPDAAEISPFWADWHNRETALELHGIVLQSKAFTAAQTLGQLADIAGVAYGSNKTATKNAVKAAELRERKRKGPMRKTATIAPAAAEPAAAAPAAEPAAAAPAAPAVSKEQVLALFCQLSPEDQESLFLQLQAARDALMRDVTPRVANG